MKKIIVSLLLTFTVIVTVSVVSFIPSGKGLEQSSAVSQATFSGLV